MGIPIPGKDGLYIETGPCCCPATINRQQNDYHNVTKLIISLGSYTPQSLEEENGKCRFDTRGVSCHYCPACRTYEIATRFWVVVICPIIKCLTVLEFSFILFDLCLFITIFNFILNYVLIVTYWIFTYHKIWILLIIYCFIWNYWIECFGVLWVNWVNWCQFAVEEDGLG